ncbi:MAG: autotransporter outer membrane beta-barrel domain-containing protein [Hyphomicrobiales bacterium]|nr:autotransporter outer membrane beta-barrel domain-containing protein [Hyphomicrobiales bacterium]
MRPASPSAPIRGRQPPEQCVRRRLQLGHAHGEQRQERGWHRAQQQHARGRHFELGCDHGHRREQRGGYHWVLPTAGTNVSVTPYAALDYVNSHVQGFTEAGGFGALTVNATDGNSFQTTLGARITSRIAVANYGVFIPELRLGWNHEFGDVSQTLTAALVGVPGETFSSPGITFGRDAVLIGAGFSMELSPDAKVFVDYDGRLGSRLQENPSRAG